jgi:2-polyprenyl-3-methyl-5-hydroxy-6-metoxy-1,4-benzoquinol methylase
MIDILLAPFIFLFKIIVSKLNFSTGPRDRIYNYIQNHINNDQRILNVGSGDGILSQKIRSNFGNICVHDIDVIDLRHDKTSPNFHLFDGYNLLQYETGYFDVVLVIYVLHHVKHRNNLLNEIMLVAKKVIIIEDILHEPKPTILDHFFTFTHRLCSKIVFQDTEAYVKFWTKSQWFKALFTYRPYVTFTSIPEKKWYHYVDHGMFVCFN